MNNGSSWPMMMSFGQSNSWTRTNWWIKHHSALGWWCSGSDADNSIFLKNFIQPSKNCERASVARDTRVKFKTGTKHSLWHNLEMTTKGSLVPEVKMSSWLKGKPRFFRFNCLARCLGTFLQSRCALTWANIQHELSSVAMRTFALYQDLTLVNV